MKLNIEKRGNEIFMDGEKVVLRGICYREPYPWEEIDIMRDLKLFKEANINYIRALFYPFSSQMLQYCEEIGFYIEQLVIPEKMLESNTIVQCDPSLQEDFLIQVKKIYERDKDFKCILLWSLGHDCVWGSNLRCVYNYLRKQQDGRLINFHFPMTIPEGEEMPDVWSVDYISYKLPFDRHYDNMVIGHTQGSYNEIGYETGEAYLDIPVLHEVFAPVPYVNRDEIDRDSGIHEFWGESIKRFCEKMAGTNGTLGGAVLAAYDDKGAYEKKYEKYQWGILDKNHNPKPEYYHLKMAYSDWKNSNWEIKDLEDTWIITNAHYQYEFSKENCLLIGGYINIQGNWTQVLCSGPFLQATGYSLGEWQGTKLQVEKTDGTISVQIKGKYGMDATVTFTLVLYPNGRIDTCCEIVQLARYMPHTVKANIGVSPGGLNELGIWYLIPDTFQCMEWVKEGIWDSYPENHIGRVIGTARKENKDDFFGMKHHIYFAKLMNQESFINVHGFGNQSIRLEKYWGRENIIDSRDKRIQYHGNWQVMNDYCGNYQCNEVLSDQKGDTISFCFEGTGITFYGAKDMLYGNSDIYIDGKLVAEKVSQYPDEIDFQGFSRGYEKRYGRPIFAISDLAFGNHNITIYVRGDKESGASGKYVSLDYFLIHNPRVSDFYKIIINEDFNYPRLVRGNYMRDRVVMKVGDRYTYTFTIGGQK